MKELLLRSPIGPAVWENSSKDQGETTLSNPRRKQGMRRDWLAEAKEHWLNDFDWRQKEDYINSFPQFTVPVVDDEGAEINIHFMALFSEKPDAIPVVFYHGWPGSFLEFLKIFTILKERYSPKDLPYHVIAPSLVGYAYTSGPPVDTNYTTTRCAATMHKLMCGLGFDSGYLAQGGDLGSFIAKYQAFTYDECKSMHVNMLTLPSMEGLEDKPVDRIEKIALARGEEFRSEGFAYAKEHGTRAGTIGLALSASPLAMLAWIGEKFLEWTDQDPPLDEILTSVSLYWLTDTYSRCIYPYRSFNTVGYIDKPCGFSFFPMELYVHSHPLILPRYVR